MFAFFGAHHLAAPGDDAAICAALVILAGIAVGAVEIGLRTAQIPFGVGRGVGWCAARLAAGARPRGPTSASAGRARRRSVWRRSGSRTRGAGAWLWGRLHKAAVLDAAIDACALSAHFRFQLEIAGLAAFPDQVGGPGGFFAGGFGHDSAVLYVPDFLVPIPVVEGTVHRRAASIPCCRRNRWGRVG